MFGLLKSLNPWLLLGIFSVGAASGTAATYPIATWKERAAWTAPMKELADKTASSLEASEKARAEDAAKFTAEVNKVADKNKNTQEIVTKVLDGIGDLNNEVNKVRIKLVTVPVGSCNFTVDADKLRRNAYKASAKASGNSASETGEANSGDAAPDSAPGTGKSRNAPPNGTGSEGN